MFSSNPVDQIADSGVGQAPRRLGDFGHLVEELLSHGRSRVGRRRPPSPAWPLRSGYPPRPGVPPRRAWPGRRRCRRLPRSRSCVAADMLRLGSSRPSLLASGARRCGDGRGACGRRLRPRTAAAVAARRSASAAAACLRLVSPFSRSSRSSRYWSSSADRRSSGVSGGRPSMSICLTIALGEPALDGSEVLLEPADHHVFENFLLGPARRGRSAAGRGSPAGRRSCSSGRCAAWPRGTAGARTGRPGRGRPG